MFLIAMIVAALGTSLPQDKARVGQIAETLSASPGWVERGEITKEALRTERFDVFCKKFGFDADVFALSEDYLAKLAEQSFLFERLCF